MFVKSDGSLWGMGWNPAGELGDGTTNDAYLPKQIIPNGVVAVVSGGLHTLFIKSDGSLWGMGGNAQGQLGIGTFLKTNTPQLIAPNGIVMAAAGANHSLLIKSDGSIWSMGRNDYGQLGIGTTLNTNLPQQILSSGGIAVAAVGLHSLFLTTNGVAWAMGNHSNGQLGDGFTNGISMVPGQTMPMPLPVLTVFLLNKTNLQINAACNFGGKFLLMAGTNLALPLDQWSTVTNKTIKNRTNNLFKVALTNSVDSGTPQRFYILRSQ